MSSGWCARGPNGDAASALSFFGWCSRDAATHELLAEGRSELVFSSAAGREPSQGMATPVADPVEPGCSQRGRGVARRGDAPLAVTGSEAASGGLLSSEDLFTRPLGVAGRSHLQGTPPPPPTSSAAPPRAQGDQRGQASKAGGSAAWLENFRAKKKAAAAAKEAEGRSGEAAEVTAEASSGGAAAFHEAEGDKLAPRRLQLDDLLGRADTPDATSANGGAVVDSAAPGREPPLRRKRLLVVWDAENCPVGRALKSTGFRASILIDSLIAAAGRIPVDGWQGAADFRAKGGTVQIQLVLRQHEENPWHFGNKERESLIDAGVTIIDPGSKAGAVDTKVKELLLCIADTCDPATTACMLIGGDRDFAPEARLLRDKQFDHLVLMHVGTARQSVKDLFTASFGDWYDLRKQAGLAPIRDLKAPSEGSENEKKVNKVCWDFQTKGKCRFGSTCKFSHKLPEASSDANGHAPQGSQAKMPRGGMLAANASRFGRAPPQVKLAAVEAQMGTEAVPRSSSCQKAVGLLRCAWNSAVGVALSAVVAGAAWLACCGYPMATQISEELEDFACRVQGNRFIDNAVRPQHVELPFQSHAWTVQALPWPWRLFPVVSCWTNVQVQRPCTDAAEQLCWNALGPAFSVHEELSLLTFSLIPTSFAELRQVDISAWRCDALLDDYRSRDSAFSCSMIPNNAGAVGVLAASRAEATPALLGVMLAWQREPLLCEAVDIALAILVLAAVGLMLRKLARCCSQYCVRTASAREAGVTTLVTTPQRQEAHIFFLFGCVACGLVATALCFLGGCVLRESLEDRQGHRDDHIRLRSSCLWFGLFLVFVVATAAILSSLVVASRYRGWRLRLRIALADCWAEALRGRRRSRGWQARDPGEGIPYVCLDTDAPLIAV
eukprot:TRINITY_DN25021_c0_g2_i5.p1 TRINITY_DN25021_c0_g2~~TRINITY_DN25021_c0_g2_i5.p1  ORF type:complete len:895 (+),score=169.53 TRINITY_DN25021_c0_g2_i5:66-2750(+)